VTIMGQKAYEQETDRQGRLIPKGVIEFAGGEIAVWRADMLAWSVTGSARAWGSGGEMLRAYGSYKIIRNRNI
jgi:hypothetical protein